MGIRLGTDTPEAVTSVPNIFIDEYMGAANGEYVKVYLYLLRCMNSKEETVSISRMADKFDHTEKDVKRALLYWEKVKLLRLEFDEEERIIGITLVESPAPPHRKKKADNVSLKRDEDWNADKKQLPAAGTDDVRPYYTRDALSDFGRQEDVKELVFFAESLFGRTLSHTDLNTVIYWYDGLSLSADLIEYLIEYCVENGHKSIRYMDKVAVAWKEKGIHTRTEARTETQTHSRLYGRVVHAFGISGRNLAESELALVEKWRKEYGFSEELIVEACRRTIQSINSPNFGYTDTILSTWQSRGVKNLEDVQLLDREHFKRTRTASAQPAPPKTGKFNISSQHTYNYDQLEQQFEAQLLKKAGQ